MPPMYSASSIAFFTRSMGSVTVAVSRSTSSLMRLLISIVLAFADLAIGFVMLACEGLLCRIRVFVHDIVCSVRCGSILWNVNVKVKSEARRIGLLRRIEHHGFAIDSVAEEPGFFSTLDMLSIQANTLRTTFQFHCRAEVCVTMKFLMPRPLGLFL